MRLIIILILCAAGLIFVVFDNIKMNHDEEAAILEENIERNKLLEKIKKRKIRYYANCPGCGAPRKQGAEKCEFCGRSLLM